MEGERKIRVLIVDDHREVRTAILALLRMETDITVVGEASDGQQAIDETRKLNPDVVLIDIRMPVMDGLEATRHIQRLEYPPKVLVITQYDNKEYLNATWSVGGNGFLSKKHLGSDLVRAIHSLVEGGSIAIMGE